MSASRDVEHHLPLKPVDFHILLVLTDGDLHGYGIVKEIEVRTQSQIRLEPGNLYRYIRRLVDEELVRPAARREVADAERRRYYRVTSFGREVLAAEALRMRSLVAEAAARLTLPAESP